MGPTRSRRGRPARGRFLPVLLTLALTLLAACGPSSKPATQVAVWGSSSAERMVGQAGLAEVLGVDVYNGGVGGELAAVIAARQGGSPALLEVVGGVIPSAGPVAVTNRTFGARKDFELAGALAGVEGTLRSDGDGYVFVRRSSGPEVAAAGAVPLISDVSVRYAGAVTLLWMGKNDLKIPQWQRADEKTHAAWAYAQEHSGKVLVMGHFADTDMTPGSASRDAFDQLQSAYVAEYGASFIDVESYVGSPQIWADTSITPTGADLTAQQAGTLPPSLDDGGGQHLSTKGYRAVAEHLVKPRLQKLGWIP